MTYLKSCHPFVNLSHVQVSEIIKWVERCKGRRCFHTGLDWVTEWIDRKDVNHVLWPSQSPDLNSTWLACSWFWVGRHEGLYFRRMAFIGSESHRGYGGTWGHLALVFPLNNSSICVFSLRLLSCLFFTCPCTSCSRRVATSEREEPAPPGAMTPWNEGELRWRTEWNPAPAKWPNW